MALHGLAERNPLLELDTVDRVIYGNVIQEVLILSFFLSSISSTNIFKLLDPFMLHVYVCIVF